MTLLSTRRRDSPIDLNRRQGLYPEHGRSYEVLRQNADTRCNARHARQQGRRAFSMPAWSDEARRGEIEAIAAAGYSGKRFC